MLGGIAEVYAYGSEARSPISSSCCDSEGETSKVCDASSAIFGGFKNSHALPEDFILFAECDENSGPEPLIVIPKGGGKRIDLNAITLKLLSSDYQGYGSTSSVPIEDAQALFSDVLPNIHAVVNYFALADIHSRGYVRPVCVAYLSSDKFKLVQNFLSIKKFLSEACRTIKFHNRCLFIHETENTIQDLTFTKEVMEQNDNAPVSSNPTVSRLQEELLDVTIADLQSVHENLQPLIDVDYNEQIQDAVKFLRHLGQVEEYKTYHSIIYHHWQFQKNISVYRPQVLKLPLRSNYKDDLRPTEVICDIGFLIGLYHLYVVHKVFMRKSENIFLSSEEKKREGKCLKFGACLKQSVCQSQDKSKCNRADCNNFLKPIPVSVQSTLKDYYKFMDSGFLSIVSHFHSKKCGNTSQPNSIIIPSENTNSDPLFPVDGSCVTRSKNTSNCLWHGYSAVGLLDVIDQMETCPDAGPAFHVLHQCAHIPDLFYSLFMGQSVVVTGPLESASTVQALVRILGALCPRDPKMSLYAQPWREVPTSLKDLSGLALLGMPLPSENSLDEVVPETVLAQVSVWNIKSGSFSGFPYKGILLNDLSKRVKCVTPKGPLLATIVSFLIDLELKVQIWRSLCRKSNQGSILPNKYFTKTGYSRNDLDILETLSTMVS